VTYHFVPLKKQWLSFHRHVIKMVYYRANFIHGGTMSKKLLQLHFAFNGPFGSEMSRQLVELAESINQEPGFIWKVWTESEKDQEAGGIYLFENEETALAYLNKHTARLKSLGVDDVICKIFDVNEPLTVLNHGHL